MRILPFVLTIQEEKMTEQTNNRFMLSHEKTALIRFPYTGMPVPEDSGNTVWAILMNDGTGYRLMETELSGADAVSLINGKYRDGDVLMTVSADDIFGRIACLNSMVFL